MKENAKIILSNDLEVIDVERRRIRIYELCLLVKGIAEGVRRSDWHSHVVAISGINVHLTVASSAFFCELGVGRGRDVEANSSLRDQERLVVHFVPALS